MYPLFRLIAPSRNYNGIAQEEWQLFVMVRHSWGVHLFYSTPDFKEMLALLEDLGEQYVCY